MKLIDYEIKGQGEPLILLRGLGRNRRHWLGFDDLMARNFQIISCDNRGFGRSRSKLTLSTTMYDFARDLIAILDKEGIQKAHLMGVSLGGMIAMATSISHPDRILSQTIINSSIGGQMNLRITPRALYTILRWSGNRDRLSEQLAEILVSPKFTQDGRLKMIDEWKMIERESPTVAWNVLVQLLAAVRFHPQKELQNLHTPTLVVYGADDALCPNENSFRIHQLIPGSRLVKIEDSGHELMTDKPEELKAGILDFITSLSHHSRAIASN